MEIFYSGHSRTAARPFPSISRVSVYVYAIRDELGYFEEKFAKIVLARF